MMARISGGRLLKGLFFIASSGRGVMFSNVFESP